MEVEADPAKDEANIARHGVSLTRAVELEGVVVVRDDRSGEPRFRLYGAIDGVSQCAAVTMRGSVVRVIGLCRAHANEMRRHGL